MVTIFSKWVSIKKATVGALMLASAAVLLPACSTEDPEAVTTPEEQENVTREDVVEDTESLVGQTVSIRGKLQETVGEASFLMDENQLFGGEEIMVINVSGQPLLVPDVGDSEVQVTGEVENLVIADVEREYGLTLEPELYTDYEDRPVIIAESVALAPDPGEITRNPEQFYNQTIAVEGEVEDILSPNTFTIDEDQLFADEDLLVVTTMPTPETQDGEVVTVTGILRPYIASDFERDYDLNWDLSVQEQIEAEYTEKPVFVAEGVYPSAK